MTERKVAILTGAVDGAALDARVFQHIMGVNMMGALQRVRRARRT